MLKLVLVEMLHDPMTYWMAFGYAVWVAGDVYMRRNGMI